MKIDNFLKTNRNDYDCDLSVFDDLAFVELTELAWDDKPSCEYSFWTDEGLSLYAMAYDERIIAACRVFEIGSGDGEYAELNIFVPVKLRGRGLGSTLLSLICRCVDGEIYVQHGRKLEQRKVAEELNLRFAKKNGLEFCGSDFFMTRKKGELLPLPENISFTHSENGYFRLYLDGRSVARCIVHKRKNLVMLQNVYTNKPFRGMGLCGYLIEAVAQVHPDMDMMLHVSGDNKAARKAYIKSGFCYTYQSDYWRLVKPMNSSDK